MKKIYEMSVLERKEYIVNNANLDNECINILYSKQKLDDIIGNNMIENYITTFELPMGFIDNLIVNNKKYIVPFVTEEPSVIAAQNKANKIIGNIESSVLDRLMIGEVAIEGDINISNLDELKEVCNKAYPSILKRGGGVKKIEVKKKEEFSIIYIYVDTCEAMGANMINTMLESLKNFVFEKYNIKPFIAILSNYSTSSIVSAKCMISIDKIGMEVASNIVRCVRLANVDVYRAVTNNKGIMNGIDAVLIATGNDFRATDASIHAFASKTGKYKSLTNWSIENNYLVGSIELPLNIATVGGSINVNPITKLSQKMLKNISVKELMMVIASVGLSQNFAALYALVTTGIQKGHMKLHYRNMALLNGAKEEEIDILISKLVNKKNVNSELIKEILENIRKG